MGADEVIALEGAEGALVVVFDLGAVAEEVFVDEVVGVAVADVEHAEGEAFVGVRVGLGVFGVLEAGGQAILVEGLEPAALSAGEAVNEPLLLGEALDEEEFGGALGLEVIDEGLFEGVVVGLGFEREDMGLGVPPVRPGGKLT